MWARDLQSTEALTLRARHERWACTTAAIPTEGDLEQGQHLTIIAMGCRSLLPGVEVHCTGTATDHGAHSHTNSATATWHTCTQHPTTSVLTAAVLVYTHGAGITAAAGTRLALQLILITVFGLHPFQVPLVTRTGRIAAVRCCLTRSASALGNLRACCPPW